MGGGFSSGGRASASTQPTNTAPKVIAKHPEDVDKTGLLFPAKDAFKSEEFTRWSVNMAMEVVFEKFEELEISNVNERTYLAFVQPLGEGVDIWNDIKICPTRSYIKAFIIDYDPTKKSQDVDNLFIYSYLVQSQYENNISEWLKKEIDSIHD